jgi:hypothetical protein
LLDKRNFHTLRLGSGARGQMNFQRSEVVRAAAALSVALVLTIVIGALLGFSTNPAAFRAHQDRITEFHAEHPVIALAELDAFYAQLAAEPQPETPPEVIAIIQWHWLLYAGLMFAGLLAIRPGRKESAFVGSLASVLTWAVAGVQPAIASVGAFTAYLLIASLVPVLRRPASHEGRRAG